MPITKHDFTKKIEEIVEAETKVSGSDILERSSLIQYLNIKTKAANRGAKARSSFANHYALYVLIEDYVKNGFHQNNEYKSYDGAQFSKLLARQRELPFGSKLQNHALNHRLNEEFGKYFPSEEALPIIRDIKTNRYWINENLLFLEVNGNSINLALSIKKIIQCYIAERQSSFKSFIKECNQLLKIQDTNEDSVVEFIKKVLRPNVDSRIFEIVSYAILKQYYLGEIIFWGYSPNKLIKESLTLYKTGRTNANDGGIDFVMRPLGRFFQVTESVDVGKYFLDIDKVQRYPITFVIKTDATNQVLLEKIKRQAEVRYGIQKVVNRYMSCIEEIINVPSMIEKFNIIVEKGGVSSVIQEIILQTRIEFNLEEESTSDLMISDKCRVFDL